MKSKKRKQLLSFLLAVSLLSETVPAVAIPAQAKINETLVSALTEAYEGDEVRARKELEVLYQSGLIDENGNLVSLDIRENYKKVTLSEITTRIANGENVGTLTVNGHAATKEQLMKIQQMQSTLELIQLLSKDVQITDEHVSNFESLLKGIEDGSVDFASAMQSGTLSVNQKSTVRRVNDLNVVNSGNNSGNQSNSNSTSDSDLEFPLTKNGEGTVDADTEGKYTDHCINGSVYTENYSFQLVDPKNKTYYTDSTTEGIKTDGVITLSCADSFSDDGTVTVTATLNKAQPLPVSFDYAVSGGGIGATADGDGTITWEAGQTGEKTFTVTLDEKTKNNLWNGDRAIIVRVGNIQNAVLSDNQTAWYKKFTVHAEDSKAILANYTTSPLLTLNGNGSSELATQVYNGAIVGPYCNLKVTINLDRTLYSIGYRNDNPIRTYNFYSCFEAYEVSGYSTWWSMHYIDYLPDENDTSFTIIARPSYYSNQLKASVGVSGYQAPQLRITSLVVETLLPAKNCSISSISVPEGTYYSGQVVPITVELDQYVVANKNTILKVNNKNCPLLDTEGIESNKFTFAYTIDPVDAVSLNVQSLSGLTNSSGETVEIDGSLPSNRKFDAEDGVNIVPSVKQASIDFDNICYGISDDEATKQLVTALIPLKENAKLDWLANEEEECTTNGKPISLPLPEMPNASASYYIKGAYFSYDNGKTRFPVYVVDNNGEIVALAARFTPPKNETSYLRKDNLNLFMDMNIGIEDASKYLDTWENAKFDENGFAYFDGSEKTNSAPAVVNKNYPYYVKGGVRFEAGKFTSRGTADYLSKTDKENGYLNLDDGTHVYLQDAQKPENRYDVEILADDAFYNAVLHGARAEDTTTFTLSYQFSDRMNFIFKKPEYFSWKSLTPNIAKITTDENGVGHVQLTGNAGEAKFQLTVGNGSEEKAYTLPPVTLTVIEGKTPFLSISDFSKMNQTLTDTDTDVLFASNVTVRNAQAGQETTTFTATLYSAKKKENSNEYEKEGTALWSGTFDSTVENPCSHVTIPADALKDTGLYAVEITVNYQGGKIDGRNTLSSTLTETAFLQVKQAPAVVKLNQLENYYVTPENIPHIGYTVTPSNAEVTYTIQKSGEEVSERIPVSGGVIPFSAQATSNLKETYTITVYARSNSEESWSVDSMLLTVYNPSILHQIVKDVTAGEIGGTTDGTGDSVNGTTVEMDNHGKLTDYGISDENYQLSFQDFNALRTDMSLQKIVSMNYGETVYGLLSDKMQWESSDSNTVSVDYEQGGIYSDVRNYKYTSYTPATDFLLVGKGDTEDENAVTITATHAKTGSQTSFHVTTKTLKDQLYVFQFNPAVETTVTYTKENGDVKTFTSNEKGELAIYEPDGIFKPVMAMSKKDGKTYVGTLFPTDLETGERDIASLQLYPCNNLRLRAISNAELTFIKPDGKPYSGEVTIRGGVYKNGEYCPEAKMRLSDDSDYQNGREDITATVKNGKLNLRLDPTQFKIDPTSSEEIYGAKPGDTITYVFEYRFADSYRPGYVMLNASTDRYGASTPTDSLIQMKNVTGGIQEPQIVSQVLQQYYDDEATPYTRNVINFTENIGISNRFNKASLTTDMALVGETVTPDDNGYATYQNKSSLNFALYTPNNQKLTGQTESKNTKADQILKLSDMDESTLFLFPFSSVPIERSIYTMTDDNLSKDGITDIGDSPKFNTPVKTMLMRNGVTIKNETLPFGVSNLSHQKDLSESNGSAEKLSKEVTKQLGTKINMGSAFNEFDAGDMLRKGFVFLGRMSGCGLENGMYVMLLPTEDPGAFRMVLFVGYNKRENDSDTDFYLEYDPNKIYDDYKSFSEQACDLEKTLSKKESGSSFDFNYYGTIIFEARNVGNDEWTFECCGGNVGTNLAYNYEWTQNFMCGPVPFNISFDVGANLDIDMSFANKNDTLVMLTDAAIGISLEAFAGLGFDLSLVKFKLGIFGKVTAKDNYLHLTKGHQDGNQLSIHGEVGLKFEAKVLLISYEKTLCSTSFGWDKEFGNYSGIQNTWEKEGYANLAGVTNRGNDYHMQLLSNGTAIIDIDKGSRIENRDYLKNSSRTWSGLQLLDNLSEVNDGMTELQSSAYPYANPVLSDDGSMFLYISDNNNPDKPESVVCYAVRTENGYIDQKCIDTSEDNILADTDAVVSGAGNHIFASWVKQMDSPEKEMNDEANYDDLGMMLNATEIYGSYYNGTEWTTQRLTENTTADMSPTIASSGNNAIVAWRSLSATSLPETPDEETEKNKIEEFDATKDITARFNAENSINYRIYNSATNTWNEAQVAYNGSAGTVNAIDSAMLENGTAILVYTVRTGEDATSTETFYTLIDANGEIITTGSLTNDNYTDTNVQVTTVGNQFVIGWYSEHEANETGTSSETVVSHDIRLARIDENGSVDTFFPESLGGTSASSIGSNFRFSAPAGNEDLNQLSIVWSQKKDDDSGKYQLNAIRFYEEDNTIHFASPTTIAESSENYVIDHFDVFTDQNGEVNAVLVGSDYNHPANEVTRVGNYDTIDLTNLPIQFVNESGEQSKQLEILEKEPSVSMKFAKGAFPQTAIEAVPEINLYDLMPESNFPVQFTVKNTGTNKINSVEVNIDGQVKRFENLDLSPAQSAVLTVDYLVPESVKDVSYTVKADNCEKATVSGTLTLNRPDVGISSMKVVNENEKTRDVQVILGNNSNIPLTGSEKTVKLAFYKDSNHQETIGDVITIDASDYQEIDNHIYIYRKTFNIEDFISDAEEIPEEGIQIYARAWVEDVEELYTTDNNSSVTLKGLLSKYQSQITMDASLIGGENNHYSVVADISNNSLQDTEIGSITADILDSKHNVLKSVELNAEDLTLTGEQTKTLTSSAVKLNAKPAMVSLRSSTKSISLDANGGICDAVTLSLDKENKPVGLLPEAVKENCQFTGWFTKQSGGEQVTSDTVLEGGATLYAQFISLKQYQSFTVRMNSYTYDGTAHQPTIIGKAYGNIHYYYYTADANGNIKQKLSVPPTEPGNYVVEVFAYETDNYHYRIVKKPYSIFEATKYQISVKNGAVNGETSGKFNENAIITVKSNKPAKGKKFGYWTKNGSAEAISYNTSYTFKINSDIQLEAVYLDADDEFKADGRCMKDSVDIDKTNRKITFSFLNNVPENCTIVKCGAVATSDAEQANALSLTNAMYVKEYQTTAHNCKYTWTKSNVEDGQAWYVKGYLIYKDKTGKETTVYSYTEKATLNGSQTILEEKILGTAMMSSVTSYKNSDTSKGTCIDFVSLLNVPADCKIKFAGIVATSDATKKENLTKITATERIDIDGCLVRGTASSMHTVQFTWTKTNVGKETWYVRPYLVYTDSLGREQTVYGELTTKKLS